MENKDSSSSVSGGPAVKAVNSDECGCVGLGRAIHFCPLHDAAPSLYEALEELLPGVEDAIKSEQVRLDAHAIRKHIRAALALANPTKG